MTEIDTSAAEVERLALAADEVWCDLPLLMGRASNEGHAVGRQLAYELRVKTRHTGETLRALVAERDDYKRLAYSAQTLRDNATADRDRLAARVAELEALVRRAQACMSPIYATWHDQARAALAGGVS